MELLKIPNRGKKIAKKKKKLIKRQARKEKKKKIMCIELTKLNETTKGTNMTKFIRVTNHLSKYERTYKTHTISAKEKKINIINFSKNTG